MTALPDFEAWAIFARVVESGSFAKAAEVLITSQPTVSKAVARLEQRLGTALLYRTSRRLSLTPTGQAAYESAMRLLIEGETMEAEMSAQATTARGLIRITAPMSFGQKYLAPLLPEFLDRYPEIQVDLSLDDHVVDLLAGGFDLAIRIAELPDSSLRSRMLCTVRRPLVASPSYFDRHGRPQHPQELVHHACLLYTNLASPNQWLFYNSQTKEQCAVPVWGPIRSNNADVIVPALLSGHGLALQPEFLVWDALCSGELEEILPQWHITTINLNLVTPLGRTKPARVTMLMDYLTEKLSAAPWSHVPRARG
ncbi:LysR family transcriptional regulator [Dyella mobilis]|uniref:LysR family transcriptional regulator n=1 Tax=Dyella mobilis TaxID=1849582 RepID=A0ABS2KCQ0_9GAMM|nr:LysR family transcriptional regulator [Dyella mobilis]MBM7128955.1 LysR family transcriptional regulator [Dyella mobilis]GLQ99353.1 transcriptional regulator [Dyella mobilis]